MLSAGSDKRLNVVDVKKGKLKYAIKDAHSSPINTLIVIDDDRIATGDDDGCVRIWDVRQQKAIHTYTEHGDYISAFDYSPETHTLYAAGADGCISVVDMKKLNKPKGLAITKGVDDDLVGLTSMNGGASLYAAGASGSIYEFDTNRLYQVKTHIKSNSTNISSMLQIKDGLLSYATDDGIIYALDTKRTKFSSRLTDQTDEPIIDMSISRDAKYLASCSLENIRFYNAIGFFNMNLVDVVEKQEKEEEHLALKKKEKSLEKKLVPKSVRSTMADEKQNAKKRKKAGGVQSENKKTKVLNQARKQFLHDLLVDY